MWKNAIVEQLRTGYTKRPNRLLPQEKHMMTYTKRQTARAKDIFDRQERAGKPSTMTYAVAVPLSKPWRRAALVHQRTWRDCLVQACRELREEDGDLPG